MKKLYQFIMKRKRVLTLCLLGTVAIAYSFIFLTVSLASSPTDTVITSSEGEQIAYLQWRDADSPEHRVILVHGAPADAGSWERVRQVLADRANNGQPWPADEWIAIDRPGYGNSTVPEQLTLAGQANALVLWLEDEPENKPVLLGHSYGGPVVLRAAIDYPEQVGALVLVAGATDAYMNDSQWFRHTINSIRFVVPKPWAVANRELLALTDENQAMEHALSQVTCPVVIVHGTWDPVCPYEGTVAYLQSRLVNAATVEVVSLERVGHNIHLSHPEIVLSAIDRAIELMQDHDEISR